MARCGVFSIRYYFLLDSYSKLMEACMDVGASSDKWLSRLTISSWLTHIKEILNCGCLIAQVLEKVTASAPISLARISLTQVANFAGEIVRGGSRVGGRGHYPVRDLSGPGHT